MYQSDLSTNKSLLTALNRHNDNYSSVNLNQDLVLVTALISVFLQRTDFTDIELFSINRKELCEMIELKRRLFETNIKLKHIKFTEDMLLQKMKAFSSPEIVETVMLALTELLFNHFPAEKVMSVIQEAKSLIADAKNSNSGN